MTAEQKVEYLQKILPNLRERLLFHQKKTIETIHFHPETEVFLGIGRGLEYELRTLDTLIKTIGETNEAF